MKVFNAKDARANFAAVLDGVVDDAEEAVITRAGGREAVVVISLSTWNAIKETEYLLSNPATAERLRKGIAELDAGRGEIHDLIDADALPENDVA